MLVHMQFGCNRVGYQYSYPNDVLGRCPEIEKVTLTC